MRRLMLAGSVLSILCLPCGAQTTAPKRNPPARGASAGDPGPPLPLPPPPRVKTSSSPSETPDSRDFSGEWVLLSNGQPGPCDWQINQSGSSLEVKVCSWQPFRFSGHVNGDSVTLRYETLNAKNPCVAMFQATASPDHSEIANLRFTGDAECMIDGRRVRYDPLGSSERSMAPGIAREMQRWALRKKLNVWRAADFKALFGAAKPK